MISLVTAKVTRANDMYAFLKNGKCEKYLVRHNENESATGIIVEYLTPYAVEYRPVSIENVVEQKDTEVLESAHEDCPIYKVVIRGMEDTLDGRMRKFSRKVFVQAPSLDIALKQTEEAWGNVDEYEVVSVQKTPIIEIK